MKTNLNRHARTAALLLALTTGAGLASETTPPASALEAVSRGKASLNVRARYESVAQTALRDAAALTLRTRLGYATAPWSGLRATVELENIVSPDGDRYSQAGLNAGGTGRAVVPDPEGSEINQAYLSFTSGKTVAAAGRQRLVLDNARFVGDVAWRQNMQTFDMVSLQNRSVDKLTFTYAYLARINRIFGDRHPQGNWDSDSHVVNASFAGLPWGTLTGYSYLLDFDNAAAQSTATYGLAFAGARGGDVKATYRAEYAVQTDAGPSLLNYRTDYYALELGISAKPGALALGYEVLGSDRGVSFRTPLATLHAFNGWADLFLTTPGNGLRDAYLKVAANLPGGFSFLGFYHRFTADRLGADYGNELDLQVTRKFGPLVTGLVKFADFRRDSTAFPNVKKLCVQAELAF